MTRISSINYDSIKDILFGMDIVGINFVVWKNIHQLDDILSGKTDIDIYISPSSVEVFRKFCISKSCIYLESPSNKFLDIEHIYFPTKQGCLFHFHVYYKLYTGESHIKNYLIPFANELLENKIPHESLVYVVNQELENMLILFRHYIKVSSIIGLFLYLKDFKDYKKQILRYKFNHKSSIYYPFTSRNHLLFSRYLNKNLLYKYFLGKFLRFKCKKYSIYNFFHYHLASCINLFKLIYYRFLSSNKKKLKDGYFVGITGVDGSGKSTIIQNVYNIFRGHLRTKVVHYGRPKPTLITLPFAIILSIRRFRNGFSAYSNPCQKNISLLFCLRSVILAYERYRLSCYINRLLNKGYLVISDRYPSFHCGTMDSPRIPNNSKLITSLLHRLEIYFYNRISPVNLLFETEVDAKTAISRNSKRSKSFKESDEEIITRLNTNMYRKFNSEMFVRFDNNGKLYDSVYYVFNIIVKQISSR